MWEKISIASLALLGFLLGAVVVTFNLPTSGFFQEAKLAWDSLQSMQGDQKLAQGLRYYLGQFASFSSKGPDHPHVLSQQSAPGSEEELILVSGGPYEMTDRCPPLGCMAWLTDRQGEVKHVWKMDPDLWRDLKKVTGFKSPRHIVPMGIEMAENGDLLVAFQGRGTFPFAVGFARFDKDGNLLWKQEGYNHHWFSRDEAGQIYVPAMRIEEAPYQLPGFQAKLSCEKKKIMLDQIQVLSPEGKLLKTIDLAEVLLNSDYVGLIGSECDPLHLNDVRVLTQDMAKYFPMFKAGDLLISMAHNQSVAVIDPEAMKVRWISSGRVMYQHSPRFSRDGTIWVFDNQGGPKKWGGSRVVRMDPGSGEMTTLFPKSDTPEDLLFRTSVAGQINLSADEQRMLVALYQRAKIYELDTRSGKVLWSYHKKHDVSAYLEEEKISSGHRIANFFTTGAYYVPKVGFAMNGGSLKP
uniref:Uncharacterized protein n=1 Tax=Magnetococcus massalia (strain MO-1) TaxID=451514 RepID=A0A1S7LH55_MAGMO|nr:Exported protein of unknown function [Candidatus Magnetococcus massalia]